MRPLLLAFAAALLFGASTPASKLLLEELTPLQLAGLLYLGAASATGPLAWRERGRVRGRLERVSSRRLVGANALASTSPRPAPPTRASASSLTGG